MKEAANRGGLLTFSLFYSFLCRINTGGNLPPSITVIDMTRAGNRAARSERHPITFGGLVVIPARLRHGLVCGLFFEGPQILQGFLKSPKTAGEFKPAFGGGDEFPAVARIALRLRQYLFGTLPALGYSGHCFRTLI